MKTKREVKKLKEYKGKVIELFPPLKREERLLYLDMPRKPDEARMCGSINSLFHEFLGKSVKITIEEIEE